MPRIHVGIRAKPHAESALCEYSVKNITSGRVPAVKVEVSVSGNKTEFVFDQFFGEACSQADLFESCGRPVADEVLDGYNGSIFAYGQTGAGKTYTVSGPPSGAHDDRGLCSRTIDYLFNTGRAAPDSAVSVKFSAIEIYNDVATDLLRPTDEKETPKLLIMDSPGGVLVPDLLLFPLASAAEGHHKLFEANMNRSVAEHQLNRQSSRSHAIYTFHVTRTRAVTGAGKAEEFGDAVQSKLNLIDLAGSERIEKSGSTGGLAKEAAHINRSLTFLEQVVVALTQSKRDHIPYRQSKLTYLLKDSLGGNCNTYLIACIWTSAHHGWETLSTLRFASRMKCIENNPIRNKMVQKDSSSSTRHLMNQIEALKKELAMRDVLCGRAEPWVAELSRQQTAKTGKALLKYMSIVPDVAGIDAVDVPEIHSLAEARYMLGLAKSLLWEACERKESRLRAIVDLTREAVPPMKEVTEPEDSRPYASPMADALPLDAPAVEDQLLHSGDHTSETPQPAPISFEDFKTAAGADGQAKYNAAKQDLKIGKDKQRQLVRTINFQKGEIDRLNEIIQRCKQQELESGRVSDHDGAEVAAPEETGPRDNFEESLSLIEAAKKAYRDAHTELLVSKKEVEDLQLRKKKCLAEVMSSYQAYCGQVGQSTVDC